MVTRYTIAIAERMISRFSLIIMSQNNFELILIHRYPMVTEYTVGWVKK